MDVVGRRLSMLFQQSTEHVRRARHLLAAGDENGVRHAALELRMAIERIAYRFLPLYSGELTDDVLKGWNWQPKRVIAAILNCNPEAEADVTIAAGFSSRNGNRGELAIRGTQRGLPKKLFSRDYDKLGSLVHIDPRGNPPNVDEATEFLHAVGDHVEKLP